MSYNLTKEERETIINYNEENADCNIYTRSRSIKTKMDKLVKKFPKLFIVDEVFEDGGASYFCDKKYVKIVPPRPMTKKQKAHLATIGYKRV